MTGKIIKGIAGFYYIHNGHDKVYACKAKGIFRNRGIKPVVGDNVEFTVLNEEALEGNIDEILPRKNVLVRPASANVDQALVVFAITQPDPNFNLLDRFLIMMLAQDIPVTICFNKTDLETEAKQEEYRNIYEQAGYPVMFVSTYEKSGVDAVRDYLRGKTTILAGPSGSSDAGFLAFFSSTRPAIRLTTSGIRSTTRSRLVSWLVSTGRTFTIPALITRKHTGVTFNPAPPPPPKGFSPMTFGVFPPISEPPVPNPREIFETGMRVISPATIGSPTTVLASTASLIFSMVSAMSSLTG